MPSLAKTLNGYAPSALPPFAAVSTVVEKNVVVTPVCVRARALARSLALGPQAEARAQHKAEEKVKVGACCWSVSASGKGTLCWGRCGTDEHCSASTTERRCLQDDVCA